MTRNSLFAMSLTAALAAFSPAAFAADPAPSTNGAPGKPGVGWAGIGLYHTSISIDIPGFGSVGGSSTDFGLNAGAGYAIHGNDALSIMPFANIAIVFPGGGEFLPITLGAGARFDKLGPIKVLAGAGLTLMPELGVSNSQTPIGLALVGMLFYPLPQVATGFGVEGQLMINIMNDSTTQWTLNVGAAFDLF